MALVSKALELIITLASRVQTLSVVRTCTPSAPRCQYAKFNTAGTTLAWVHAATQLAMPLTATAHCECISHHIRTSDSFAVSKN
jgi:hypothetical protein